MDAISFDRIAIVGAGGPTGFHLATAMLDRGTEVRVIGRHLERLTTVYAGLDVDAVAADATDLRATTAAVNGCDLVVDCIGLPPEQMHLHPETARTIAAAVSRSGARCLQVSSFWSYLPITHLPLTEDHPREGGVHYVQWRRKAENTLQKAGAAIVNLPDFFGPRVHGSTLQQALADAVAGRPMNWIGETAPPREYVFVPDAMNTVAALACRPEAYGNRWIVAGAGPISGDEVTEIAKAHLGYHVTLRAAGRWMLWLASLFSKPLRQFMPMVPDYCQRITYDGSKLHRLLGDQRVTPYQLAIPRTLDWLRDSESTT